MPDYKNMYVSLFRETTKAINILQAAQQKTEDIYIADDGVDYLRLLPTDTDSDTTKPKGTDRSD